MDNKRPCCKHHDFEMPKNIIFSLFLTLEETTSSQHAGQIKGMFDIGNTVSTQKTITTQVYHGMCFIQKTTQNFIMWQNFVNSAWNFTIKTFFFMQRYNFFSEFWYIYLKV